MAPDGNDAGSGRLPAPDGARTDGPLATPARARDAARAAKGASGPVRVRLRRGTYVLAEPWTFRAEDGGTPDAPVVYEAFEGIAPVLSGGTRLVGWTEVAPGRWEVAVPVGAGPRIEQLYVDGGRRYRPRLPASGYHRIAGEVSPPRPGPAARASTASEGPDPAPDG